MREKIEKQIPFQFERSNLKITNQCYEAYEKISDVLDKTPEILKAVHKDLEHALETSNIRNKTKDGGFTSDNILRMIIVRKIEGLRFREVVVRIDDSQRLRFFVRIYDGQMMDYTTLNKLENSIQAKTWERINELLSEYAVGENKISGEKVRVDTTAVETNVHYPTDSWLLWDCYRIIARLLNAAREIDATALQGVRLHEKKAKKLYLKISRGVNKKKEMTKTVKEYYRRLLDIVGSILVKAERVVDVLALGIEEGRYGLESHIEAGSIIGEIQEVEVLARKVMDQATRRVLRGEKVPNEEKVFSIFEPHTELLIRGKAGKPNEFGHMMQIQQVVEKFITHYDVFKKKPNESEQVPIIAQRHYDLFGKYPEILSADKGYAHYNREENKALDEIEVIAIGKKGKRTEEEEAFETSPLFRLGQRFRAGIEGTISFLKRILGLARSLRKGLEHYKADIGSSVFAHNLLVLAKL